MPIPVPYGVRVRNTPEDARGAWATFARIARERAGVSQSELARRMDTDRTTIWRWENGRQKPENPVMVVDFARVTGVELSEAMAAAGLVPDVEPPTEPTREADEEMDLILQSKVSPAMKKYMIDRLLDLRERDKQRRMEDIRFLLERGA